jgi:hypothetical protein
LYPLGFAAEPLFAKIPILVEQTKQAELWCVLREPLDLDLLNDSEREASHDLAEVVFEPPDHHVVKHLLADLNAAAKSLWVEDLQKS